MTTISASQRQKKIQANFRKAEQLRSAREARERQEREEAAAQVPHLQRRARQLQDQVHARMALPIPGDFYEHILHEAAHQAARKLMETVHDEMCSEPFFPAIGRVAEGMWNGAFNMSIIQGRTPVVEASLMEAVWDQTYKFRLDIPGCTLDRVIDQRELRNLREFGEPVRARPYPTGERVVLDTPDVRSYRSDV